MTTPTNKQLRRFLLDSFNDDELETFCFDYFPEVRRAHFGHDMNMNRKVIEVIDYCDRLQLMENLLGALEKERPIIYQSAFFQERPRTAVPLHVYKPGLYNPKQIFISHSSNDAALAHQISDDLKAHNYDIFITPESIRPGEKWVPAINRGLEESGVFLVLLTPHAVQSRWVNDEMNTAISLANENIMQVFLLDVDDCSPPIIWRQRQLLSFRGKDYKRDLANLLQTIKGSQSTLQPAPTKQTKSDSKAFIHKKTGLEFDNFVNLLAVLPEFRTETDRLNLLKKVFSESIRQDADFGSLDLNGSPHNAAKCLITHLAQFEQDEMGKATLGPLYAVVAAFFANRMIIPTRQPLWTTPGDLGLSYEEVQFPAKDGIRLAGWFIPTLNVKKGKRVGETIILIHAFSWNRLGYAADDTVAKHIGGTPIDMLRLANHLCQSGYNVLTFDLRNHGESAPQLPFTFGEVEADDLLGALDYLVSRQDLNINSIGVIGFSTGANTILYALPKTSLVKAAILVQPMTPSHFLNRYANDTMGSFSSITITIAESNYYSAYGKRLSSIQPSFVANDAGYIPVLYIQANDDPWGDAEDVSKIAEATPNARGPLYVEANDRFKGYQYLIDNPKIANAFFEQELPEFL